MPVHAVWALVIMPAMLAPMCSASRVLGLPSTLEGRQSASATKSMRAHCCLSGSFVGTRPAVHADSRCPHTGLVVELVSMLPCSISTKFLDLACVLPVRPGEKQRLRRAPGRCDAASR